MRIFPTGVCLMALVSAIGCGSLPAVSSKSAQPSEGKRRAAASVPRSVEAVQDQPADIGRRESPDERFARRIALKGKNRAPDAIFVPTPQEVVDKMLELAEVTSADVVCDLGSGDGRIVITAAKQFGARAIGYEIDKELVAMSREKLQQADVGELARIEHEDIFSRDLSEASVVTMFLPPLVMDRLLPQLARLKPGSCIVSHHFTFRDLPPEKTIEVETTRGSKHEIHLWTTPLIKKPPRP